MANNTVIPKYRCFLFSDDPKWERKGKAHLSYYASTYYRVENNQPQQDLFYQFNVISCVITYQCLTTLIV